MVRGAEDAESGCALRTLEGLLSLDVGRRPPRLSDNNCNTKREGGDPTPRNVLVDKDQILSRSRHIQRAPLVFFQIETCLLILAHQKNLQPEECERAATNQHGVQNHNFRIIGQFGCAQVGNAGKSAFVTN